MNAYKKLLCLAHLTDCRCVPTSSRTKKATIVNATVRRASAIAPCKMRIEQNAFSIRPRREGRVQGQVGCNDVMMHAVCASALLSFGDAFGNKDPATLVQSRQRSPTIGLRSTRIEFRKIASGQILERV